MCGVEVADHFRTIAGCGTYSWCLPALPRLTPTHPRAARLWACCTLRGRPPVCGDPPRRARRGWGVTRFVRHPVFMSRCAHMMDECLVVPTTQSRASSTTARKPMSLRRFQLWPSPRVLGCVNGVGSKMAHCRPRIGRALGQLREGSLESCGLGQSSPRWRRLLMS
jgi:hypothetical protein